MNLLAVRSAALRAFAVGLAMILCGLAMAVPAAAYEVSPMRIFLQPSRGDNSATIMINNIRPDPLPVEIVVLRRTVAIDGTQTLEPVPDQFVIFPPQVQIPAGQTQAVRIQYLGPAPQQGEGYVVQVTEVPVNQLEGSGIQFTYNFGVAVYVQPQRPRARLQVSDPRVEGGQLRFTVRNPGNDTGFLNAQSLTYEAGEQRVTLDRDTVTTLVENPIVPPGGERAFAFPAEGLADGAPVTVAISSTAD